MGQHRCTGAGPHAALGPPPRHKRGLAMLEVAWHAARAPRWLRLLACQAVMVMDNEHQA
jgi:hypothetical protein